MQGFVAQVKEIFDILFLSWFREWREAGKIDGLQAVEKQLFFRYLVNFPPLFISSERKQYDYPENNFFFGEIPYSVCREIAGKTGMSEKDAVYDLGCGRGKVLFCLHLLTGARCIGIDLIERYINIGEKIVEKLNIRRVNFFHEDITNVDLSTASVVIAHCSCFSLETHEAIVDKISSMKPGSWFITVSISYDHPYLELVEKKEHLLSWGRAPLFYYRVVKPKDEPEAAG